MFDLDNYLVPVFSDGKVANEIKSSDSIPHRCFTFIPYGLSSSNLVSPSLTSFEEANVSNTMLKYINHILLEEEDTENRNIMWQDSLALQAIEKSLYDVLGEKYPPYQNHNWSQIYKNVESQKDDFSRPSNVCSSVGLASVRNLIGEQNNSKCTPVQPSRVHHNVDCIIKSHSKRSGSSSCFRETINRTVKSLVNSFQVSDPSEESQAIKFTSIPIYNYSANYDLVGKKKSLELLAEAENSEHLPSQSRGKKSHCREDNDEHLEAGRSNKQLASFSDEINEQPDMFDKVLLCRCLEPLINGKYLVCLCNKGILNEAEGKLQNNVKSKGSIEGKKPGNNQGNRREVVDLFSLLTHCAQAVASNDSTTSNRLLKQIKRHSSPLGDGIERMAHYVGNAIEARLAGTGRALDATLLVSRLSNTETLKAYSAYLLSCPFIRISNFFANKWIWKIAERGSSLHIIDFGIIHGFQWPHLIQHLSLRPGGPPSLRITGIDFPQPGFRPAERAEETGRLLTYYCKRFNVPFEYNGIAKKWDAIQLEDLKIRRDEVLIVNCLYRLRYVHDETVEMSSPRNVVLNLIKRINPDLFIHGVVNGTYNAPFFLTRFRDLLFHLYAAFDMFDVMLPREDQGRMLFEREAIGRVAKSVIACEGVERVIRPESYKQWKVRNMRAGLEQIPLDQEIIKDVRDKIMLGYHKDFVVEEDSNWMLQGWKGRIFCALSCWKPNQETES